jgi:hypothetical protein
MSFRVNRILRRGFALVALAMFAGPAVWAAAGKVLLVSGTVSVEGRKSRALETGDAVEIGDTVVTDEQSRVQLLMADGSRIALRASSQFRIDELALPSSVQKPGLAVSTSGRSAGTLLKGGFSTREGAIGKNDPSTREMHTPIGTLGTRDTSYTVAFCRGNCANAPAQIPGQAIPDGLYIAVDEGEVTFNGRGLALTLTAPRVEYIPLDASDPQQLAQSPAFLRNDGAGAVQVAGRPILTAASNGGAPQPIDRRVPGDGSQAAQNGGSAGASSAIARDGFASDEKPEQRIFARTSLGLTLDLLNPDLPQDPQSTFAFTVPPSSLPAFTSSTTALSESFTLNAGGSLRQFNASYRGGPASYLSGTASLVDFGSNGSSEIRWGRWSNGSASIHSSHGVELVSLQNASLHWIMGPSFELAPLLPVSGSTSFVLAGGTSPTDMLGNAGTIGNAVFAADFTAQQVSATLSIDVNGYNWYAAGNAPLSTGSPRFSGTFGTVLIDGRLSGSGAFSGFLSAGALSPDQVNGVGLSYWLTEDLNQLGSVSGVLAFVPGPAQSLPPPVVQRNVAYSLGRINQTKSVGGVAANARSDTAIDANGNLTRFTAPVPDAASGSLGIGVASNTNTGVHAATGIRWGRWEAGAIDVMTPPAASESSDLTNQSLHWIAGNELGSTPMLPQTGSATYTLVGNTNPTDTLGNVGTIGTAVFAADFTNRSVTTDMTLQLGGFEWYVSGAGMLGIGEERFTGTYGDVTVANLVRGQGLFRGFLTFPRLGSGTSSGAGLSFNLSDSSGQLGYVSGVLAFAESDQSGVVVRPAVQSRDIAIAIPDAAGTYVQRAAASEYALNQDFDLTNLPGVTHGTPGASARYDIGTSSVAESDVAPLVMLRWGRWSGGDAIVTPVSNGSMYSLDLAQKSLHWVQGADSATPPVMPQFGSATYALLGATSPTDHVGNVGILNNASLNADFTNQLVSAAFDVTVNNVNVIALGSGVIGMAAGLPAHQFSGDITGGVINPGLGPPSGSFSGFFTAPGGTVPGVPGGVGVTYSITDGFSTFVIEGAAALRGP